MITSKYVPPTNYKPSRIKVECARKKIKRFYSYDHALDCRDAHIVCVRKFCEEFDLDDNLFQMDLDDCYAYSRMVKLIAKNQMITPERVDI